MAEKSMKCRICGKEIYMSENFGILHHERYFLPFSEVDMHGHTGNEYEIGIFHCRDCMHMQIPFLRSDTFYIDSYKGGDYATQLAEKERIRQVCLLAEIAKSKSLFLDIGCGEGISLDKARIKFDSVIGVEPSPRNHRILESKKLNYISGYFSKKVVGDIRCSAFISTQVFDHLDDPLSVLKDIYEICAEGAVGIIEVADGQKVWETKDFPYLYPEHVSYFSPLSLSLLAYRAGFFVEQCVNYDGKNLEILLRKPIYKESFTSCKTSVIEELKHMFKGKRVSVYGIGDKAITLIPMIEKFTHIQYMFDSNQNKHGKYISASEKIITAPDIESVNSNDIILLFGTKYDKEIENDLRGTYGYRGEIYALK